MKIVTQHGPQNTTHTDLTIFSQFCNSLRFREFTFRSKGQKNGFRFAPQKRRFWARFGLIEGAILGHLSQKTGAVSD